MGYIPERQLRIIELQIRKARHHQYGEPGLFYVNTLPEEYAIVNY